MWTGPGDTSAKLPAFQYGNNSQSMSSRWLMSTDYLRLKNLTFGVRMPQSWSNKIGMSNARIYFSGSNLLTWKSKGLTVDPEMPVSGEYEIGTPLFSEIQMHLDNGKTFTVLAPGVSRENIYIQSVKVNGQPYDKSYITHRQIMDGATVEFEMGPEPGNIWYR
jgi:hypothetical protein